MQLRAWPGDIATVAFDDGTAARYHRLLHETTRSEIPMPLTSGFNHVATMTTDLDRLVGFYRDAFGAEITFEMEAEGDHPRMAILDLGGGAALNAFEVPEGQIIGEQRSIGRRGAIDHFALAVDSLATLEGVRDRVVAAGGDIGEIQRLGHEWSLFFRDIDGMELEVCCHADDVP